MYCKNPEIPARFVATFSRLHKAVFNKWYVDELYDALIVNPTKRLGTGLWQFFDVRIVDGIVNGVGRCIRGTGELLRHTQTGYTHSYAMSMVIGVVLIIAICVFQ
jgi:NADH-quinone oxidoreductase subunit L